LFPELLYLLILPTITTILVGVVQVLPTPFHLQDVRNLEVEVEGEWTRLAFKALKVVVRYGVEVVEVAVAEFPQQTHYGYQRLVELVTLTRLVVVAQLAQVQRVVPVQILH
jgi:hypothetical protein